MLAAAALFWLHRREERGAVRAERPAARLLLAAVVLVTGVAVAGTTVQIVRIGHSGAAAAWSEVTAR